MFKVLDVDDILPIRTTKSCGFNLNENDEENHNLQYILMNDFEENEKMCLSGTAGIINSKFFLIKNLFRNGYCSKTSK